MSNFPEIAALDAVCDKSHNHATFAVTKQSGKWHFSTSDEAAYPTILCNRVARIIVDKLLSLGYSDRPAEWKPDEPAPQNSKEIEQMARIAKSSGLSRG